MQANAMHIVHDEIFVLENCYFIMCMLEFYYPLPKATATALFEAERNSCTGYTLQFYITRRVRRVTLNGYNMAVLLVPLKNGFSSTKS